MVAAEDLAGGAGISLAKVVGGPEYVHADGVAIQAVWSLHDGREIPQLRLTAVEISELLESATDALRWLRNGVQRSDLTRDPAQRSHTHAGTPLEAGAPAVAGMRCWSRRSRPCSHSALGRWLSTAEPALVDICRPSRRIRALS